MDCRNRKCCGLLVFVVQFVKVLVEERRMVDSMKPVSPIVLEKRKKNRRLITIRSYFLAIHFCPLDFAGPLSSELRAIIFKTHECHLLSPHISGC
jgi:hypothetical protein